MAFKRKPRPANAPELTPDEALAKLEHFCAYRDRCSSEVWEKIRELKLPPQLGETLFNLLETERFFDDNRFAEVFVRGKFRGNHWGKIRLRMELVQRKLPKHVIERALETIEEDTYLAMLAELLQKKRKQWEGDPQARQKAAAAMIRMGYEPDLVFSM